MNPDPKNQEEKKPKTKEGIQDEPLCGASCEKNRPPTNINLKKEKSDPENTQNKPVGSTIDPSGVQNLPQVSSSSGDPSNITSQESKYSQVQPGQPWDLPYGAPKQQWESSDSKNKPAWESTQKHEPINTSATSTEESLQQPKPESSLNNPSWESSGSKHEGSSTNPLQDSSTKQEHHNKPAWDSSTKTQDTTHKPKDQSTKPSEISGKHSGTTTKSSDQSSKTSEAPLKRTGSPKPSEMPASQFNQGKITLLIFRRKSSGAQNDPYELWVKKGGGLVQCEESSEAFAKLTQMYDPRELKVGHKSFYIVFADEDVVLSNYCEGEWQQFNKTLKEKFLGPKEQKKVDKLVSNWSNKQKSSPKKGKSDKSSEKDNSSKV